MKTLSGTQVKAEGLIINSVGQRPTNWRGRLFEALKGRNPDDALSGLKFCGAIFDRALPYPNDYKAFSLNLTAIGLTPSCACGLHGVIYVYPLRGILPHTPTCSMTLSN